MLLQSLTIVQPNDRFTLNPDEPETKPLNESWTILCTLGYTYGLYVFFETSNTKPTCKFNKYKHLGGRGLLHK